MPKLPNGQMEVYSVYRTVFLNLSLILYNSSEMYRWRSVSNPAVRKNTQTIIIIIN